MATSLKHKLTSIRTLAIISAITSAILMFYYTSTFFVINRDTLIAVVLLFIFYWQAFGFYRNFRRFKAGKISTAKALKNSTFKIILNIVGVFFAPTLTYFYAAIKNYRLDHEVLITSIILALMHILIIFLIFRYRKFLKSSN